jgi:toxin FitB
VIRYLLDTNVISELRKLRPHAAVVEWLNQLRVEQIFVSAVTVGELQAGIERTRRQNAAKADEIETWLGFVESSFAVLPMTSACFRQWARLMSGRPGPLETDAMIAATAHVHGLTVATRNERDFAQLGVEIVNPFKAR